MLLVMLGGSHSLYANEVLLTDYLPPGLASRVCEYIMDNEIAIENYCFQSIEYHGKIIEQNKNAEDEILHIFEIWLAEDSCRAIFAIEPISKKVKWERKYCVG